MGLDVGLVLVVGPEGMLENQIGFSEALLHITPVPRSLSGNVGVFLGGIGYPGIISEVRMQDRRAGHDGFLRVQYGVKFFVFDLDQVQGLFGDIVVFGSDRHHFLSGEPDHVPGQDGHIPKHTAHQVRRNIVGGQHGMDARHLPGFGH